MKNYLLLFVAVIFTTLTFAQNIPSNESKSNTTTYYLIRHAEKDRTTKSKNPELTLKGKQRAEKWKAYLDDYNINAIYSTPYARTTQTARPIARETKLNIQFYDPFKLDIKQFLKETQGKNVLIVGHSNTTPEIANKLIGENIYQQMKDTDNSSLYIITINGSTVSHKILTID